ncbi:MAG: serine/threonine-protein kinase [Pirellulaceae bacterium]
MSTVDEIRQGLVESGLMSEETVDGYLAAWQALDDDERKPSSDADAEAEQFVHWLIQSEVVTELHGEALLAGYTGPFVLGPYLVKEQIAGGRGGGVFRAEHEEFNQPVSLKIFPRAVSTDEAKQARFGREVRIVSELDHANVVRAFQVGRLGDIYYLALESLTGETLRSKLMREGRLPYAEACRLIRDVAKGLAHMHEHEVIHRDLRPDNIWLTSEGKPKIMEFGASVDALAHIDEVEDAEDEQSPTIDDMVVTRYDYMPPEQAYDENCADALSDIYSLGCILYHCLTGRPPFIDKHPIKKVLRHVYDQPTPPSELFDDIPRPIDDTVAGMLAKQYEKRFQKAEDVAWALEQYVGPEGDDEQVAVVDVSPQYLQWAQSQTAKASQPSNQAEGASPELTRFLDFISERKR